jgi:hypothetical protein
MNNLNHEVATRDYVWIETLAMEEMNMEDSGFITFNEFSSAEKILEASSIEFLNKIKDRFEFFVGLFNQYRVNRDQGRAIKVFRISNTVNDFMLFRNSLKLIVSRRAIDVIHIGFLSNSGGLFTPKSETVGMNHQIHEIKAHMGPFHQVTWRYQGEIVSQEALVKYYMSEFIRGSAR